MKDLLEYTFPLWLVILVVVVGFALYARRAYKNAVQDRRLRRLKGEG